MNRKRRSKLERIYDKIPAIKCKGLCFITCGELGLSKGEFVQLTKVTGKAPKVINGECNYLVDNKCTVYKDRPSVCRLYGVVENMRCPYGCEAERILTEREARAIMDDISRFFGESCRSYVTND